MRIFFPLIIIYILSVGALLLALIPNKPKQRVWPIVNKVIFYPGIFMTVLMAVFAAFSLLIDQGFVWFQFAFPLLALAAVAGLLNLAWFLAQDLRKTIKRK